MTNDNIDRDKLNEQIYSIISREGKIDRSRILPTATLESLEVESVDLMLILMAIEEKFNVYVPVDEEIAASTDVASFVDRVAELILKSPA